MRISSRAGEGYRTPVRRAAGGSWLKRQERIGVPKVLREDGDRWRRRRSRVSSRSSLAAVAGHGVQNDVAEIVLLAERRLGDMLAEMELSGRGGGDTRPSNTMLPGQSLADLGITKMQSSRWQAEARVPDDYAQTPQVARLR